jgi:hypothetical protein
MPTQAHFFVDNSNLIGGAQRTAQLFEPTTPWFCIRVDWRNFFELLEGQHLPVTRVFAGSLPPGNEELWEHARRYGYNTDLLHRIERDDGRLAEQGVDELLHLKIANALLDYDAPQKLVLVTVDGNPSEFNTSFLTQVKRAIKLDWDVEIWSWKSQLSGKFARLPQQRAGQLTIHELDPFYMRITFVKALECNYIGTDVPVRSRRARSLQS